MLPHKIKGPIALTKKQNGKTVEAFDLAVLVEALQTAG